MATKPSALNRPSFSSWFLALVLCWAAAPSGQGADPAPATAPAAYDYSRPKLLTGTLYAVGSNRKTVLFTFRRTAISSGSTVHVERQFLATNGTVAAVEKVVYQSNQLVSFEMVDFQADVSGSVQIEADPGKPGRSRICISYTHGLHPPKGRARTLQANTLIDDTLYPFLIAHWNDLILGKAVKFRFVSLEWGRTFEFELRKTGDAEESGTPVVRLSMKPTSLFVARLVNPLIFTVSRNGPHRILSYIGRTTPRVKNGNSWKYLDAETVFN